MKGAAALALALYFAAPAAWAWPLGGAPAPVATATCGPDAAPPIAVAHGFNCEVFWDNFANLSTVDLNHTWGPAWSPSNPTGFKWYLQGGGDAVGNRYVTPSTWVYLTPPGTEIGGMSLDPLIDLPIQDSSQWYGLWNMGSCAGLSGGGFVGNTLQGSMYADIQVSSIGNRVGNWWPVVWFLSIQQLGYINWGTLLGPEVDFWEFSGGGRMVHEWNSAGHEPNPPVPYGDVPVIVYPIPKTYGVLILKPGDNGGNGTIRAYENDVLDTTHNVTWPPGGTFSSTSEATVCFLITSGYNQPLTIRSIRVWQAR